MSIKQYIHVISTTLNMQLNCQINLKAIRALQKILYLYQELYFDISLNLGHLADAIVALKVKPRE